MNDKILKILFLSLFSLALLIFLGNSAYAGFWVEGDNHMHTTYSDGDSTPNVLKEVALGVTSCKASGHGLDFIVITDHSNNQTDNDFHAWDDCLAMTSPTFIAVDGCEVTKIALVGGHINCIPIDLNTFDHSGEFDTSGNMQSIMDQIHARGGWAIANHPVNPLTWTAYDFSSDDYDALEIWNGSFQLDTWDNDGIERWLDDLGRGKKTVAVGGSDCHKAHTEEPGSGETAALGFPHNSLWVENFSWPSIINAYRQGKVVIHDYNNFIDLKAYRANNSYAGMIGETFWVKPSERIKFSLDGLTRVSADVKLWKLEPNQQGKDKSLTFSQSASGNFSYSQTETVTGNRLYYAETYHTTNPVGNSNYARTNAIFLQVDGSAPIITNISKSGSFAYATVTEGDDKGWLANNPDGSGLDWNLLKCYYTNNYGVSWNILFMQKVTQYSQNSGQFSASLPSSATAYYIEASDKAGNTKISSTYYLADSTPPTGSIIINSGENYTTSNQVNLSLSASDSQSGVDKMIIANDTSFTSSSWEKYSSSKSWTLPAGSGIKTVYAKFKDYAGNPSSAYSDSIELLREKSVIRLFGQTRYETAVAISQKGWNSARVVVLARGDLFPDALAGAVLAFKNNAPILLTYPQSLHQATSAEIKRLKADKIIILGSEDAVSKKVVSDLIAQCGIKKENIQRLGGINRYETASLIAQELKNKNLMGSQGLAFIATGENYPDALAAASLSAFKGWPIILTDNREETSQAILEPLMKKLGLKELIILGGTQVVKDEFVNWLKSKGYKSSRISGDDRYGTAKAVAEYGANVGLDKVSCSIATGENFPDALTAGPLAAADKSAILLTSKDLLRSQTRDWISANKNFLYLIYIAGGPDVVSEGIKEEIANLIK